MNIQIPFPEISGLAEQKNIDIQLSQVNDKTVKVGCAKTIKVFGLEKTIHTDIDLTVEKVVGNDIFLAYSGSSGMELIIRGFLALFKSSLPSFIEQPENSKLVLHLDKIEQAEKILQHTSVRDITVGADGLHVEMANVVL